MKLTQFFEQVYVPTYLADARAGTVKSYRLSVKKLDELCNEPSIYDVNLCGTEFIRKLKESGIKAITIAKHCRELNVIFSKLGPQSPRNRNTKALLKYCPYFCIPNYDEEDPLEFCDDDFRALYNAFEHETEYPRYLPKEKRPFFWQTIMYFVSITAIRRQAVWGLEWKDINRHEYFVRIRRENDKKRKQRFKPIQSHLIELLEQIRPNQVTWDSNNKIFTWKHGIGRWYECWHKAEDIAGIKMGLHDLKRFSGDLAIRAGASDLELMQHMDHRDIQTTLKHYCRPKTRNLVNKIVVPVTREKTDSEPLPPIELKYEQIKIAPAFVFYSLEQLNEFYKGELARYENAEMRSQPLIRTPGGTILTLYEENHDEFTNPHSPTSRNGNDAG
jgi:integrase